MALGRGSAPPGRTWHPAWLAAAAILIAAVSAGIMRLGMATPVTQQPTTSEAPAAPAVPGHLEVRPWARTVEPPPVDLPADLMLARRGTGQGNGFLEAFGVAIAPYRDGRYEEAARLLSPVVMRFPDVPEAAYYLGLARLLSGDASGARAALDAAGSADTVESPARWFAAVAAERAGDSAAADQILADLCARPGDFQARACAARAATR
jgi:TolA-binding protein